MCLVVYVAYVLCYCYCNTRPTIYSTFAYYRVNIYRFCVGVYFLIYNFPFVVDGGLICGGRVAGSAGRGYSVCVVVDEVDVDDDEDCDGTEIT